ncbi:MAG: hypothetical protein F6J93_39775 [Oscillatoria sp. SIO1A7]|nr:hypothetical protein [Oscillatoria sp. SIO1A7]
MECGRLLFRSGRSRKEVGRIKQSPPLPTLPISPHTPHLSPSLPLSPPLSPSLPLSPPLSPSLPTLPTLPSVPSVPLSPCLLVSSAQVPKARSPASPKPGTI